MSNYEIIMGIVQGRDISHTLFMPIILCMIIVVALLVVWRASRRETGTAPSLVKWLMRGGMLVSLLLASRIFGARMLYAFLPMLQGWISANKREDAASQHTPQQNTSRMSREEAAMVLGVEADASHAEIAQAYKGLMRKLHPDQGGNDYLASKLNNAREVLLG